MALTPRHVLIVGGGLAGPCLALSLAKHNIRSTIFEIRPTRSDSGGSISLGANAIYILDKYAGVYDRLKSVGYMYHKLSAFDEDGNKFGDVVAGEVDARGEPSGYPALRVMRSTLHKTLLDASEESGMVEVKFGVRLERIEEGEKGVQAYFEDGSTASGDILIGSDGIHSKVRQHVLGELNPSPIFAGIMIVSGFLPASSAVKPYPEYTFPSFTFTANGMMMAIPIDAKGETLAFGVNVPSTEHTREEWTELERSGEAARAARVDFEDLTTQPVRSLLDKSNGRDARIWAPFFLPDLPKWHTGRTCLIGDAAHALPPNGQGSATAFQDVAILTRLLTAEKGVKGVESHEELFARFEKIRRPEIAKIRGTTNTAGSAFRTKTNPWVWMVKKWGMRGYFWWNSGLLRMHKDFVDDVDKVDLDA